MLTQLKPGIDWMCFHVRFWHKADIMLSAEHVRYWRVKRTSAESAPDVR